MKFEDTIPSAGNPPPRFPEKNPTSGSYANLVVFVVVLFLALLFYYIITQFSSDTNATTHFLVKTPLGCEDFLEPLVGEKMLTDAEINRKNVLMIIWAPWDNASCELLSQLDPILHEAEQNPDFLLVPVVYFAAPPKNNQYMMSEEHRKTARQKNNQNTASEEKQASRQKNDWDAVTEEYLKAVRRQQDPLRLSVEKAFNTSGFSFSDVWWDPADRMRGALLESALDANPTANVSIDGIGFPTLILAENGMIDSVWKGNHPKNVEEITKVLKAHILSTGEMDESWPAVGK